MSEAGHALGIVGGALAGYLLVVALRGVAPRVLRVHWRLGVWVVPALAGVAALLAPGAPTGVSAVDAVLRAAVAVAVSRFAAGARRWAWLVAAGLTAVCAAPGWPTVLAFGLLGAAVAAVGARRWSRTVAAVWGGLLAQVLFHLSWPDPIGSTALVAAAVVGVLGVSWWQQASRKERRAGRAVLAVSGLAAVVVVAAGVVAGVAARSGLRDGVDRTEAGLAAARAGDLDAAAVSFGAAADALGDAHGSLSAWWARPSRAAPVLARYLADAEDLAAAAARAAEAAEELARIGSAPSLRVVDGRVDLAAVTDAGAAVDTATTRLHSVRALATSPASEAWLPGPVRERLDELVGKVDRALDDAAAARLAVDIAPALLGDSGPRRWFVAVHTPSEQRGAGGLIGFWGDVVAEDGRLSLGEFEAVDAGIEEAVRERATLPAELAEPLARYANFGIETYFKNGLQSPDFPTNARAIESLVPQAGYGEVDGVIAVDPAALGALLRVTGPIRVPSWPVPITARNAQRILLYHQYVELSGPPRDAFLGEVAEEVFRRLTTGDLASPAELARALGPAIAGRHVMLHSADPVEQEALVRLGVAGELLPADGGDFLQVVTQNATESKLEWFLRRGIEYEATHDPVTGEVTATLRLRLTNLAPPVGLPAYILGADGREDDGYPPPGHQRTWLSVYSALDLVSATVDGQPLALVTERELGRRVHAGFVTVPPRSTATVELALRGSVAPGGTYRLTVGAQPTAHPDRLTVRATRPGREADPLVLVDDLAQISPLRVLTSWRRDR